MSFLTRTIAEARAAAPMTSVPPHIGTDWAAVGAALIREFEGLRLVGYLCPAGKPTVGYGHTGPEVRVGMRITSQQADVMLAADMARFSAEVDRIVRGMATTACQRAAMVSFAFNLGSGRLPGSTILRRHATGDTAGAADGFLLWVKATVNGSLVTLPGLVRRRRAERALYLGQDWRAA